MKHMSLKLRLMLIISLLLGLMMLMGVVHLVLNAREDVDAEINSSLHLVSHLMDAEITYIAATPGLALTDRVFRLQELSYIRHFRISFYDARGRLVDSNDYEQTTPSVLRMPDWFSRMLIDYNKPIEEKKRDVMMNGRYFGTLVITPDPSSEIAEIWDDTLGLLSLVLLYFLAVNFIVYRAVTRALKPVDDIWQALNGLEKGALDTRLPEFGLPELSRIAVKFNLMAQTLQNAIEQNHKLAQQLIRVQEDERKNIARDLHDELSQSLTAIKMDAGSLLEMSRSRFPEGMESANAIVELTRQVMAQLRGLLHQLRPEALDSLGLSAALTDLIDQWRSRHPLVSCKLEMPDEFPDMEDAINITIYRIIQEGLTNIAKHASPTEITIAIGQYDAGQLNVRVENDGARSPSTDNAGLGLSGMRERVMGLGGGISIQHTTDGKFIILAIIPLRAQT